MGCRWRWAVRLQRERVVQTRYSGSEQTQLHSRIRQQRSVCMQAEPQLQDVIKKGMAAAATAACIFAASGHCQTL